LVLLQHACSSPQRQAPAHCRPRICLLKSCQKWFSPPHPLSRYCSKACSHAARLWSRRMAAQRYRSSEGGKKRRRQQACRYRQRVRQQRQEGQGSPSVCEGHQKEEDFEKIPCLRPGCYERFPPSRRSPLKKFCCALCRQALQRVHRREARWLQRPIGTVDEHRWDRFRGPPGESVSGRILRPDWEGP